MNYKEVLDFLFTQLPMYQRVGKVAFKKDLTNTLALADRLDNPHKKFRSIHVAGTNGKGSTAHMLASILQSSGYKVGLYTSPHLRSFRERIRVNGEQVSENFVIDFVQRIKPAIEEISPSFFEITVVMAFEYFALQQVDIAVVETGLGGRLDSTNVITPVLSVITSISLDHQDMLGDTLELIAAEKAGIIKEKIPVVVGKLPAEAHEVISRIAEERQSPCLGPKSIVGGVTFESDVSPEVLRLNLGTVLQSIDVLKKSGWNVSSGQIESGLKHLARQTGLKGRWQRLRSKPLTYCDVGHNEEAVDWLMKRIDEIDYRKLHIVWGSVEDKLVDKIFSLLKTEADYYFCAANVPRAMPVEKLAAKARDRGLIGQVFDSVDHAYEAALKQAGPDDLIFVGGSTFVVAELKDL